MRGTRSATSVVLTVASVILTVLTGVVVNIYTEIWGWALLSALLVLASCLAIVESVRRRLDAAGQQPTPASSLTTVEYPANDGPPPGSSSLTITGSTVKGMAAGRDINKTTRIGTGGLGAILVVAVLLAAGTTALGRTDAALPHGERADDRPTVPTEAPTPNTTPPDGHPSATSLADAPGSTGTGQSFALTTTGRDFDPKAETKKVVDLSWDSDTGLMPLNGTVLAPIPGNGRPTPDVCRNAPGYSPATEPTPITPPFSRCLQTSDGNFGALTVTRTTSDVFGGQAFGSVTIW